MEKEIISVDYNGHKIVADIMPVGSIPEIFCMHGAGASSKKSYEFLRQTLAKNGVSSCALDFIGYGDTGGNLEESSLKSRTEQAEVVIEKAKVMKPLSIVAGSMAAYNAIKLTEIYPVKLLVLSAPAVYDKDAYAVFFSERFSEIIRKPRSWDNTDAWEILNRYKGKIIILKGGKDLVIPPEIVAKIFDSASNASHREIIDFPEAPHGILGAYLPEHPEELKNIIDKIMELMK